MILRLFLCSGLPQVVICSNLVRIIRLKYTMQLTVRMDENAHSVVSRGQTNDREIQRKNTIKNEKAKRVDLNNKT